MKIVKLLFNRDRLRGRIERNKYNEIISKPLRYQGYGVSEETYTNTRFDIISRELFYILPDERKAYLIRTRWEMFNHIKHNNVNHKDHWSRSNESRFRKRSR